MTSGIIFNNELADFFRNDSYQGFPWPQANAPGPGKRPLSSTCPSIIVDEHGNVVLVVGGSGGTRITLSVAWVRIIRQFISTEIISLTPVHSVRPKLYARDLRNCSIYWDLSAKKADYAPFDHGMQKLTTILNAPLGGMIFYDWMGSKFRS